MPAKVRRIGPRHRLSRLTNHQIRPGGCSPIFSKVLVANRGEIAVRVQQTLKSLGIATVAVYSDPDSTAPHVLTADEAWPLGGQTATETYLDMDKIMGIALECGAEAIHPGYGFLSENPRFARACNEAGIVFIGPTPENMEALGDKIRSKELAYQAGAPVVPNSPPCERIDATVEEFVGAWGFPLLVKAAAGGRPTVACCSPGRTTDPWGALLCGGSTMTSAK